MAIAVPGRTTPRNAQAVATRTAHAGWGRRHFPHTLLFIVLLLAFAYTPPRWQDWNQNSRFDLTLALVEQGTTRIDAYADNTGDYATINGHMYSDKAPGLALAAVPVYAATRALRPFGLRQLTERLGSSSAYAATLNPDGAGTSPERIDRAVALYLAMLLTVALPGALLAVLLALLVERLWGCRTAGVLTALIFGLATPIFPYAAAFYGHVPAALCVTAAFALLALTPSGSPPGQWRLAALGCCLGLAVLIEYPAAVSALPIVVWAVLVGRWRAVVWGSLGAVPPLALLAVYDLVTFGTLLPVGYEHSTLWQTKHQIGFMSFTYPHAAALWGLSFSPFRGLFFYAPVLLLSVPGLIIAWRDRVRRPATAVACASFALTFIFFAASAMWWGGFAVGPRYLMPGLPLLAVPFGAFVAWGNSLTPRARLAGLVLTAALGGLSLALIWATTYARQNYPPDTLQRPLTEYVLPALREGDIARNLGMAAHLHGVASLAPLVFLLGLALLALGASLRPTAVAQEGQA
jgi:hypothetical protein